MAKLNAKARKMLAAMDEAARVASAMVDGEEALRIVSEKAAHHVANPDPKFRSLAGDYYDVDHATFLRMKKVLLRLRRLMDFRCNVVLWVALEALDGKVTAVVNNGTLSRWYQFGRSTVPTEGVLAECMSSGKAVRADAEDELEFLTVATPVFDSLGDTVGVIELTAQHPAAKMIAPVYN
jgi:hypothetical protein